MDIKRYIDYFKEITHLTREQQFTLLEQAHDDLNSISKLPLLVIIPLIIRVTFIALFMGGSYLIFGYSNIGFILSLLVSLLCSTFAITEINESLMLKALKKNLNKNNK